MNIPNSNSSSSATEKTRFIIRYPGSCVTFNLMQACRVKKDGMSISENWCNEDDDNILIVRLIQSNGSPWLLVHHGIYEVVKAPLFVPATKNREKCTSVCIFLRDYANNRGESNCIQREFRFKFYSVAEANSFLFTHNSFIKSKQEENKKKNKTASKNGVTNEANTNTSNNATVGAVRQNKRPILKRYRDLSSSSEEEETDERNEKRRKHSHIGYEDARRQTMKRGVDTKQESIYETSLLQFWSEDTCFENTPTPWGDDD